LTICKHFSVCGGCQYQDKSYEEQLVLKNAEVHEIFSRKNIDAEIISGIQGSDRQTAYRNKMEYTFGDEFKDGEMTLGMHKSGQFMSIITIDECLLVDQDFNRILGRTLSYFKENGYSQYHKKSHLGFQRNLIIRKGERTGELLINIVTSSQNKLDGTAFVTALLELELQNRIVGILHTTNDSLADFVYCDHLETLYGRDYYMEEVLGLKFKVSAFSFFQTNVPAIEILYKTALDLIDDLNGTTVFDLYSGTGTIAQTAARKARKAIGIELVPEAAAAAQVNADLNGLTNCTFLAGDVFDILDSIEEKPDVIILDPPRTGVHPKALNKILNYQVKQIIYISCNPKTLAENLTTMLERGYSAEKAILFDNFPHTKHIEAVVKLRLKS
jgi:23S rRNA (uracil1939-C5)-methyltransferase